VLGECDINLGLSNFEIDNAERIDIPGLAESEPAHDETELARIVKDTSRNDLRVFGPKVTDNGLRAIADMTGLQRLRIANTSAVTAAGIQSLAKLSDLRELGFYDSGDLELDLAFVEGLTNLETLVLANVRLKAEGLRSLEGVASLRALALSGSSLPQGALTPISKLAQLEALELVDGATAVDALMPLLGKWPDLKRLRLTGSAFSDAGAKHLPELANVETLALDRTQVTDAALEHIAKMPSLKVLSLRRTKVTKEGFAGFLRGRSGVRAAY
jgi:hypothetical protein